tara:strand:+ start:952 stop:1551 length:600 start_codon:yes stop_codon:yes gene_type:complete
MKTHWNKDSILNTFHSETKPSEIFKEICNSIGNYYSEKGWKYSKSRPKIRRESNDLVLEINFWSSHSNLAGSYVQLEILPYVSSKKLKKWIKENEIGRNNSIYAPKKYSFRNNNVYGITEIEFSILLNEIDEFIENELNINENEKFIDRILKNQDESIKDNLACYLAMKNDKRMFEIIENDKGLNIDKQIIEKLKKYYS